MRVVVVRGLGKTFFGLLMGVCISCANESGALMGTYQRNLRHATPEFSLLSTVTATDVCITDGAQVYH